MSIDLKDKRILHELDKNCRQSLSRIGKAVGLPKTVVSYRIKKLEEFGIIKGYNAIIDASRLGYFSIRFYINFQHTTPLIEGKIIDYFKLHPDIWWVAKTEPSFDLAVIIWIKDIKDFYNFWEETMQIYGKYFQKTQYSVYVQAIHYKCEYLLNSKQKKEKPEYIGANEQVQIDGTEKKILTLISNNARMSLIDMANMLSLTPRILKYRINSLVDKKIIIGFKPNLNLQKIGFQSFRLNIYLSDYSKKRQIENYVASSSFLVYINRTVGHADLEFEFHFNSLPQFQFYIGEIRNRFSDSIKSYDYFIFNEICKEEFVPNLKK